MIKMIATDLDGTMLKNDWSVSGINAKAVETAQGQGVRWMTVTGRSYRGAMPLMQQYGINCGYVLMNEMCIRDRSTAEIFLNQGEKVLTMKSYFTEDTLIHMNSELQIKVKTWLLEEE